MAKLLNMIKDFSGGLSEVANDNMPNNTLSMAKNVVPGDGYGISRANGTEISEYGQALVDVDGTKVGRKIVLLTELEVKVNASSEIWIIAFAEASPTAWNMLYWDGSVWNTVKDTTATEETVDMPPVKDWFVYANRFYWLDGTHFRRWDGTKIENMGNNTASDGWHISIKTITGEAYTDVDNEFFGKISKAVSVEQRSTRWYFATTDNEIIYSDIGSPETFVNINVINITSGLADSITALHEFSGGILVFQKRSVYYLQGYDFASGSDISLDKLNVSTGCSWPKTIKTIENAVIFMGDNGLYRLSIPYYSTVIATLDISTQKVSKKLTEGNILDMTAAVFNSVYYLAKRTEAGVDEYRYYFKQSSFWGPYTQQPYSYAPRLKGADDLYIGCDNGYILYYDKNSYHYINTVTGGDTVIQIEARTKGYDVVGAMVQDAKVKKVYVVLKQYEKESSKFSVQLKLDYLDYAYAADISSVEDVWNAKVNKDAPTDESLVWSEGTFSNSYWGWQDSVVKEFLLNSKCKRVQFIFRDSAIDQPLLIYGVALLYKKKKVRGSRLGVNETTVVYSN